MIIHPVEYHCKNFPIKNLSGLEIVNGYLDRDKPMTHEIFQPSTHIAVRYLNNHQRTIRQAVK